MNTSRFLNMNLSTQMNNSNVSMNALSHSVASISLSAITTAFGVIITLSFLGGANNLFLTGVIIRNKNLCTGGGILIANLLFIYGLVCMLQYPVYCIMLYRSYVMKWVYDPRICDSLTFLHLLPLSAAAWSDVCLTINRFVAILVPHKYRFFSNKFMVTGMIIFVWAMAFTCVTPALFGVGFQFTLGSDGTCTTRITGPLSVLWISLGTWIPYAAISAGYLILWVGIAKSKCNQQVAAQPNGHAVPAPANLPSARRMRVTKTLTVLFLWNSVCVIPAPFIAHYVKANAMVRIWQRVVPLIDYGTSPVRT